MNMIDRLFALRTTPPFDQLHEGELVLIAAALRMRRYAPDEVLAVAGRSLRNMYLTADGVVTTASGAQLPRVFGAASLLFGTSVDETLRAGPEGCTCLLVRRAHFHTIVNECPGLVVGLLRGSRELERELVEVA
ncbi:MAG: hypothetical protein WD737_02195 [Gemmatimonadota bacterium]